MMKDEGQSFEEVVAVVRQAPKDEEPYWDATWVLAYRGDRNTLDKTLTLTRGDAFERRFSSVVLGRMGEIKRFPSHEVTNHLLQMLAVETDMDAISALVSALGHQENEVRIPVALKQFLNHSYTDIRFSLAVALGSYETRNAIEMLIELSHDANSDVRNWATFGLGQQCEFDTPEIRSALVERLTDGYAETRAEAINGLAKRKDERVIVAIRREFEVGVSNSLIFEALVEMPDSSLLPALRREVQDDKWQSWHQEDIQAAIAACESQLGKENEDED